MENGNSTKTKCNQICNSRKKELKQRKDLGQRAAMQIHLNYSVDYTIPNHVTTQSTPKLTITKQSVQTSNINTVIMNNNMTSIWKNQNPNREIE